MVICDIEHEPDSAAIRLALRAAPKSRCDSSSARVGGYEEAANHAWTDHLEATSPIISGAGRELGVFARSPG
jgi:hypothetical protein